MMVIFAHFPQRLSDNLSQITPIHFSALLFLFTFVDILNFFKIFLFLSHNFDNKINSQINSGTFSWTIVLFLNIFQHFLCRVRHLVQLFRMRAMNKTVRCRSDEH